MTDRWEGSLGLGVTDAEKTDVDIVAGLVDLMLAVCDRAGIVCQASVSMLRKDGTRVMFIDAHGEHELDG